MMATDKYYVERCLDGHPDDFRHLVRRYQPVLLAHLAGKLSSRDRAEEAAQETLVRAYFKMDRLEKPESFFAWLLGIAENVAKEQQRKAIVRRQRESVRAVCEKTPQPELSQDYGLEAAVAGLPDGDSAAILRRTLVQRDRRAARYASGHGHQDAITGLCLAAGIAAAADSK